MEDELRKILTDELRTIDEVKTALINASVFTQSGIRSCNPNDVLIALYGDFILEKHYIPDKK